MTKDSSGVHSTLVALTEGYNFCQRNKNHIEQPVGKLMSNSIPERP